MNIISKTTFIFLVFLIQGCMISNDYSDDMPEVLREAIIINKNNPEPGLIQLETEQEGVIYIASNEPFHLEVNLENKSNSPLVLSHSAPLFRVVVYRNGEVLYPNKKTLFNFLDLENTIELETGEKTEASYEISLKEPGHYYAIAIAHRFRIWKADKENTPPGGQEYPYWMFSEPLEIRVK